MLKVGGRVAGKVGALREVLPEPPLVFSFVPRCNGGRGWQKYTGIIVVALNSWWRAISSPWSKSGIDATRLEAG